MPCKPADTLRFLHSVPKPVRRRPGVTPSFQNCRGEIRRGLLKQGYRMLHGAMANGKAKVFAKPGINTNTHVYIKRPPEARCANSLVRTLLHVCAQACVLQTRCKQRGLDPIIMRARQGQLKLPRFLVPTMNESDDMLRGIRITDTRKTMNSSVLKTFQAIKMSLRLPSLGPFHDPYDPPSISQLDLQPINYSFSTQQRQRDHQLIVP